MELYVLDDRLRRIEVIDRFESLIWTERWGAFGDFELVIQSTPETRRMFVPDIQVVTNESDRVMVIDTVENKHDSEGRSTLTVTGRSLECILDDRIATEGYSGLSENTNWELTGTPGNIARYVFSKICVEGILSQEDIIPFITEGTTYTETTISEPDQVITASLPIGTVYETVKELCDIYSLGFRLIRNLDQSQLFFEIYTGSDRTAHQSSLAPVIFSPDLDNLNNVTELTSVSGYKNVAYVFSKNGAEVVYASGVDTQNTGFKRRVLYVDANDVDPEIPAGPELSSILLNKGLDALAQHRKLYAFDGEIPQSGSYRYGVDYNLGDVVEQRTEEGVTNIMRVTEQIFVSDGEGDRSYPTLSLDTLITPGSWSSWDYNETWSEATETWETA